MHTYWAFVKTVPGAFIRVTVQAPDVYSATQMLKAMYGNQLMTETAQLIPD